ncbi:MAG: hypothetical protein JNK77_00365 [Saprospiraceae bacterium]|nr:hypothetical protein [Saprospiraceae bacterium]
MKNSKLMALLRTFSVAEWRMFRDMAASPYFNKQEELLRLCEYLKRESARDFPERKLSRERVFEAAFPGESYDTKQFHYLISGLLKLAETFIGLQRFEQDGILPDYYLLSACVERRLEKSYRQAWQKAAEKLQISPLRNTPYYYQSYLLAEMEEQYFLSQNVRRFDPHLQQAADSFDRFFLSRKLNFLCAMTDRQRSIPEPYQLTLLDEVSLYAGQSTWDDTPPIALYRQLLLALTETGQPAHFENFINLMQEKSAAFSPAEMRDLYYYAINFCIHQIRLGEQRFAEILVSLYQQGLEDGYLLEDGKLSPWTFKNMVVLGLSLRRYDWVEGFVQTYSRRLPEDSRDDAYHFNLADLHYHKGEYRQAMEHLFKVAFSDIHYSIGAKAMLLKIYYENSETEALLALLTSFKAFLHRNKLVSKAVKAPYLHFVTLLGELQKYGADRAPALAEKIRATTTLANRSWLLEQVDKAK